MDDKVIPFKKIIIPEKGKERVKEVLDTGFIGLGGEVFEFEKNLAEYVGSKYAVATDSCTSALFLSLLYEHRNDNLVAVSIPSMTVPLVSSAVIEAGVKLYFDDRVEWIGSAYPILRSNVIDSAHELERDSFNVITERFGIDKGKAKMCFSFYPTKNIGSADGGAVATNDKDFADWVRSISTYGRDQKQKYQNSWDYEVIMVGYKRHYTNLQAVICDSQLAELDERNAERAKIRDYYNDVFKLNNQSLYLYRVDVKDRDNTIKKLEQKGIQCGVHFKPMHMMKGFSDIPFVDNASIEQVNSEYISTMSLPFYYGMTEKESATVAQSVLEYVV